ncbi:BlyB family putative holin accessory protein [Candidatus Borreliella tachyglossi]|uniref:BlyB family putative holin accessory protein n=1 Tax=Candidatus Borreliella tachyglossi TaxID=1964448 RepID=UPI0040421A89
MTLSKDNLEAGLASISTLFDIFAKFEDKFSEKSHKGFTILYEFYEHFVEIYTQNMERLENKLTHEILEDLSPLNTKINALISAVNAGPENMRLNEALKLKCAEA